MKQERLIECFIPALALEFPVNEEYSILPDKIRSAVNRLIHTGTFTKNVEVRDPIPFIFLKDYKFNKNKLGYDVIAKIFNKSV